MILSVEPAKALAGAVGSLAPDRVYLLADDNTAKCIVPLLGAGWPMMAIPAGDTHKNIATATEVWMWLAANGATRHSLLVNVGGGMVTDLGGFAAATYKRGIRCVNVATSLLAMVDASSGGKTGINLNDLKNEIGAFHHPSEVIIAPSFLATLPREELLSGYGEMLKHAIIDGQELLAETLGFSPLTPSTDPAWLDILRRNIAVKQRITEADPKEKGLRKTLNLGHTVGHALESFMLRRDTPVPHGYAVAWGLLAEAVLAHLVAGGESAMLYQLAHTIECLYGSPAITCDDYPELYELMTHDKKNRGSDINFTLPLAPGNIVLDRSAPREQIFAALDIFRDLLHA